MDTDPIAALVDAIDRDGKPPLWWVVQWSEGGGDPVAAAWLASSDPWAMVQLLKRAERDWPLGVYYLVDGRGLRRRETPAEGAPGASEGMPKQYVVLGEGSQTAFVPPDRSGAEEIRRRIPCPPTLARLMEPPRSRRAKGWK